MGVNSLPKTHRGCDLKPGRSAPEFSTLTTRLPSQPKFVIPLLKYWSFSRQRLLFIGAYCRLGRNHVLGNPSSPKGGDFFESGHLPAVDDREYLACGRYSQPYSVDGSSDGAPSSCQCHAQQLVARVHCMCCVSLSNERVHWSNRRSWPKPSRTARERWPLPIRQCYSYCSKRVGFAHFTIIS